MSLITWKDSYSVGVDLIDNDHKLLVSLINQLNDAIQADEGPEVVGSVLNVLVEYTASHFGREELLMKKGKYPDAEFSAHHLEHEKLTTQVRGIVSRYYRGEIESIDTEVLTFLKNWLTGHILGVDMKYRAYVDDVRLTPDEIMATMGFDSDDGDGSLTS